MRNGREVKVQMKKTPTAKKRKTVVGDTTSQDKVMIKESNNNEKEVPWP